MSGRYRDPKRVHLIGNCSRYGSTDRLARPRSRLISGRSNGFAIAFSMPRLFVALDLPDDVKQSLEHLTRGLGDVRWLGPEQQHLTLRFIGELDNGRMYDIAEALSLVAGVPFELRLKGLGHFPPRGEPRVLWVGVEKSAELAGLKRRIDRA